MQLSDTDGKDSFEAGTEWDRLAIGVDVDDEGFDSIEYHRRTASERSASIFEATR